MKREGEKKCYWGTALAIPGVAGIDRQRKREKRGKKKKACLTVDGHYLTRKMEETANEKRRGSGAGK